MPYLFYEDVGSALEWLTNVFGFSETFRMPASDGSVMHAELSSDGATFMIGDPGPEYRNPKRLGAPTQCVYVFVDDVDTHFEHARHAGAKILSEPTDQFYGDRTYMTEDLEGHQWSFAQHVQDVAREDMHP